MGDWYTILYKPSFEAEYLAHSAYNRINNLPVVNPMRAFESLSLRMCTFPVRVAGPVRIMLM